jgi:hypothetical protein
MDLSRDLALGKGTIKAFVKNGTLWPIEDQNCISQ